jgi:hypothetical protein
MPFSLESGKPLRTVTGGDRTHLITVKVLILCVSLRFSAPCVKISGLEHVPEENSTLAHPEAFCHAESPAALRSP